MWGDSQPLSCPCTALFLSKVILTLELPRWHGHVIIPYKVGQTLFTPMHLAHASPHPTVGQATLHWLKSQLFLLGNSRWIHFYGYTKVFKVLLKSKRQNEEPWVGMLSSNFSGALASLAPLFRWPELPIVVLSLRSTQGHSQSPLLHWPELGSLAICGHFPLWDQFLDPQRVHLDSMIWGI